VHHARTTRRQRTVGRQRHPQVRLHAFDLAEAVVAVPGGQVGDIIYEVSEMPVFTEGEDVVAFVWKNPSGKNLITGGSQGKMKIEKDMKTGKRMVKTKDTDSETNGEVLENFVTKVKGYMKH
jgi:hypothetical protein